jgi:hypothetical protein
VWILWTCVLWYLVYIFLIPQFCLFFWDTRRWIKSKNTPSSESYRNYNFTSSVNVLNCTPLLSNTEFDPQYWNSWDSIQLLPSSFARAEGCVYEGVSKSFRTGRLERELQLVQLSATRCSCIAILWVRPASFAAITLCVASQRVLVVYFVIDSVRKLLVTPSYRREETSCANEPETFQCCRCHLRFLFGWCGVRFPAEFSVYTRCYKFAICASCADPV